MVNLTTHQQSRPAPQGPACLRRQRGFTLLEVLISLIVLSIGLLGLAGLQMNGLKSNNSSYQRTQASLLANEMIDRIRANRAGLMLGYYSSISGTPPTNPNCLTTGCTVQQIADYDAFLWAGELADRLPLGTGTVTGNGVNTIFTITVSWDDNRSGSADTSFVMSTTL
ncbi:MAG: type IV pilus modification protein PilV [Gammaproteobacteria bacterium]|nr:type IV pilus modification protein PilV [Gammaproteobacteria bacterium]